MKFYTIYLDGMDKTGKDSILPYIGPICNYKYVCNVRGVITQLAYASLNNRPDKYDIDQQKYCLNVLLTVDEDDWKVRCAINNEPKIDYDKNASAFIDAYEKLRSKCFPVMKINTSEHSPYEIAKMIVERMDDMQEAFYQQEYFKQFYEEQRRQEDAD